MLSISWTAICTEQLGFGDPKEEDSAQQAVGQKKVLGVAWEQEW